MGAFLYRNIRKTTRQFNTILYRIIVIQLSIRYGIEKQLNERYQKSNRHLPGHS